MNPLLLIYGISENLQPADVNHRDAKGESPYFATQRQTTDGIELLIEHGAVCWILDGEGRGSSLIIRGMPGNYTGRKIQIDSF